MTSSCSMSFRPRKNPSRCPAIPELPSAPGSCRVLDVTDAAVERDVVGAAQDRHLEVESSGCAGPRAAAARVRATLAPGGDPFRGPTGSGLVSGGCSSAAAWRTRKPIELVPSRRCTVEVQRAARHQARDTERPRGAFHEQTKTALPSSIDGLSSLHSPGPSRDYSFADTTPRRHYPKGMSCASARGEESGLFLSAGSRGRPRISQRAVTH